MLTALNEVSGGLGKEKHAHDEDDGPCVLDCDGDAIAPGVIPVLGGVEHDGGDEEAHGDGPLIAPNDSTADPFGSSETYLASILLVDLVDLRFRLI